MNTLGTALILVSTILLGMVIGIGAGYCIINAVLSAFARKPQKPSQSSPALAHGVTGD